ncbi:hypothetical protein [Fusobacterium ulcerans]|uniref:hypothetical protein n=1 Tax=Fusobacterium ulcerans TaxID=861 RepID=UPI0015588C51|nr:hypothetical protein [Fusobacterium ulcerans]
MEIRDINIYEYFKTLKIDEYFELIKSAKTKEEKEFYFNARNFLLQEEQKKIIEEGIY